RDVVGLLAGGKPNPRLGAVVEHDLLGEPEAEVLLEEGTVVRGLDGEEVDMVEVADACPAPRIALRLVLEGGTELRRRDVALGLPEQLEAVPVGVEEAVRGPMADVAVEPLSLD